MLPYCINFASKVVSVTQYHTRKYQVLKNKNQLDVTCYLLFYFLETPHISGINMPIFRIMRLYCWTTILAASFLVCCVFDFGGGSAGNPDTTPAEPPPKSNTQQTKNEAANMVVQQYSRIILKMGILMPETCWVSKM